MKIFLLTTLLVAVTCVHAASVHKPYDDSEPLILTNYLNDPATGQQLSQVNLPGQITSYSGFYTTNSSAGNNMFGWFLPAQNGDPNAPVLIWLQGGPGASSLFGMFTEIGPFRVSADGSKLVPQAGSWNKQYSLLFIDNPVGVGFSFTHSDAGFVTNQDEVADNLYSLLQQFFTIFPEQASNPFYVTGESYAGKYITSISYKILQENKMTASNRVVVSYNPDGTPIEVEKVRINMKGLSIGDGALHPRIQFMGFGDLFYSIGFCDDSQRSVINNYEKQFAAAYDRGDLVAAFHVFDEMLNGDFIQPTYFQNITGLTDYFNILSPVAPPNPWPEWLVTPENRKALHVGGMGYAQYNATVEKHLIGDWMRSVADHLVALLESDYDVMIYNGNLDLILGPALTENFLRQLKWSGQAKYNAAERVIWRITPTSQPAGWVRTVGNFHQVIVYGAGHMVPGDQPESAVDLITRFVSGNMPK